MNSGKEEVGVRAVKTTVKKNFTVLKLCCMRLILTMLRMSFDEGLC